MEIERKYLLRGLPDLPSDAVPVRFEQAYLFLDTDLRDAHELRGEPAEIGGRIRRATHPEGTMICTHTVKQGIGLVRRELERTISNDRSSRANSRSICR